MTLGKLFGAATAHHFTTTDNFSGTAERIPCSCRSWWFCVGMNEYGEYHMCLLVLTEYTVPSDTHATHTHTRQESIQHKVYTILYVHTFCCPNSPNGSEQDIKTLRNPTNSLAASHIQSVSNTQRSHIYIPSTVYIDDATRIRNSKFCCDSVVVSAPLW